MLVDYLTHLGGGVLISLGLLGLGQHGRVPVLSIKISLLLLFGTAMHFVACSIVDLTCFSWVSIDRFWAKNAF